MNMHTTVKKTEKIAVIGSGKIGRCWALLFSSAGYKVHLHDIEESQLSSAIRGIEDSANKLKNDGLFRGKLSITELIENISTTTDLSQCLQDAYYIQECVYENYELKKEIFKEMDSLVSPNQIMASSTSALPPSEFSEGLKHRDSCLVAHPVNPPTYCPVVELVPAPWTRPEAMDTAVQLMKEIGQEPVRLNKEVVGFAANRLQYAIVAECWRLVMDGVMSAEDVDKGSSLNYVTPLVKLVDM